MKNKDLEKLIVIESPFKGNNYNETEINILYARACVRDSLLRGEYPYASHLFYTQDGILNDKNSSERQLGINGGIAWGSFAKKTAVYTDRGISSGMKYGIKIAKEYEKKVEYRTLDNFEEFLKNAKKITTGNFYKFNEHNRGFFKK